MEFGPKPQITSPSLKLLGHGEGTQPNNRIESSQVTYPFATLGREEAFTLKLGDATPDDVIYLARRIRKLQNRVAEMGTVVNLIY